LRNHLSEKYKDAIVKEGKKNERKYAPVKDKMIVEVKIPSFVQDENRTDTNEVKDEDRKVTSYNLNTNFKYNTKDKY